MYLTQISKTVKPSVYDKVRVKMLLMSPALAVLGALRMRDRKMHDQKCRGGKCRT